MENNALKMNVVVACDEAYLPHAATMLCSLLENNKRPIAIFLLHNGIRKEKLRTLSKFIENYGVELILIKIIDNLLSSLKTTHHFTSLIYYRLLMPEYLPLEVKKVLYLDVDLLVRRPLDELWDIDLNGVFLAAVQNKINPNRKIELGLSEDSKYFNSGVMLINLEKWRHESFHHKVIDYVKENSERVEFPDQDGLNAVLDGDWIDLPITWNVQSNYYLTPESRVRFADIVANPSIVHFTGNGQKPWQYRKLSHPFFSEYDFYRKKTPWKKYELEGLPKKKIKNLVFISLKKIMRNLGQFAIIQKINGYILAMVQEVDFVVKRNLEPKGQQKIKSNSDEIGFLFPTRKVISGPFMDLYYPDYKSFGSTLAPKLLGIYEAELREIVEEICKNNYSTLIDIGCAEGYYACGFAKRVPKLHVYAYDTDPKARELCKSMVEANCLSERVSIEQIFTMRTIEKIPIKDRGFIVCDCEGAEEYIFYDDGENWQYLTKNYDLLIEIHDVLRPGISTYIYNLFCKSHDIRIIYSVNDNLRPMLFNSTLLNGEEYNSKVRLMAEKRSGIMMWFYMMRKKNSD